MHIDETQTLAVWSLVNGILEAADAQDIDNIRQLSNAIKNVMTGLPIEDDRAGTRGNAAK